MKDRSRKSGWTGNGKGFSCLYAVVPGFIDIYHGIKNKRGGGTIVVTGEEKDNAIVIKVIDDGIGMDEKRLADVRNGLLGKGSKADAIYGLYNVNERIRLGFGEEYGISVESTYGVGTVVSITLPKILTKIIEN